MIKILLLISESWNDIVHPNNNLTNWFSDFPEAEINTISCGPHEPYNYCCKDYFCVNDMAMVESFLPGKKAGTILRYNTWPNTQILESRQIERKENKESIVYSKSSHMHNGFFHILRDIIWRFGRYDKNLLKQFIDDFEPDIVFSQRMGSVKMCRLEYLVSTMTSAPLVAYTGDNEFFTGLQTRDPFERLHRKWTCKWLEKMIPKYKLYYCMSKEQMRLYMTQYGVKMKFLVKCGDFNDSKIHKEVNKPIRIVYAGKVYAGRWKTLGMIAEVLGDINKVSTQIKMDIYTPDKLTEEQKRTLHDGVNSFTHTAVTVDRLQSLYEKSDIVLHVESLDSEDSQATKYSFSTKIIDCMASGCAIMAICNKEQAGFQYLSEHDIAFTADSRQTLRRVMEHICSNPSLIKEYSYKALSFGMQYHQRKSVQQNILHDFMQVISQK